MRRTMGVVTALLLGAAMAHGDVAAQVSFGGQASLTNLGTETVEVGETIGAGARLGVSVFQNEKATVMIEGVGEAMFPPCEDLTGCELFGAQLNVIGFLAHSDVVQIYGGLGAAWQTYTLEDETQALTAEGSSWGVSMIIGLGWVATQTFRPFFEVRLSEMFDMRTQAAGVIGFRIMPGAYY